MNERTVNRIVAIAAVASILGLAGCTAPAASKPVHTTSAPAVIIPRDGLAIEPISQRWERAQVAAVVEAQIAARVAAEAAARAAAQAAAAQAAAVAHRAAPHAVAPAPRPAPPAPRAAAPVAPPTRTAFVGCAGLQAAVDACSSWTLLAYGLPFPTIGAHVNRAGGWLLGVGAGATVTVSGRIGGVYRVIGSTYIARNGNTANVRAAAPGGTDLAMQTCAWNHDTGMRFVYLHRVG